MGGGRMTIRELCIAILDKGADGNEEVVVNVKTATGEKSYPVDGIEIGHNEARIGLDLR